MAAVFRYLVRRVLQMVLTFFGATFVLYALMFANQDDPLQTLFGDRPVPENVRTALTERYRVAGQCSALQGGGVGPRWEGRQGPGGVLGRVVLLLDVLAYDTQRCPARRAREVRT